MSDNVVGIVFLIAIFGLWAWSVTWAMGDAERRGKPGCLVGAFVGLVSWPLSLLMWIVVRPEDRAR
jgi:hypothetical protein